MDILNSETYKVAVTIVKDFSPIISMLSAGFGAVIGLYWTNKWQDKRLKSQIDREDQRKRLEKNLEIQKDVFLRTAESIQHIASMMLEYGNPDRPIEAIAESYSQKKAALAQVHLIAGKKLLLEIINLSNLASMEVLKLMRLRIELEPIHFLYKSLNKQLKESTEKRDILFSQINSIPTSDRSKTEPIKLQKELKILNENIESLEETIREKFTESLPIRRELYEQAVEANYNVMLMVIKVNILARSELGDFTSHVEYESTMRETAELSKKLYLSAADKDKSL